MTKKTKPSQFQWVLALLSLGLGFGCRAAQADETAPPIADAQAAAWLDKLEARGKTIHSFQAVVMYDKDDTLLGDRQVRTGKVFYQAPDPQKKINARFAILFKQLSVDKKVLNQRMEYIFDGQWLAEVDHPKKTFTRRQVIAPDSSTAFNPLDIDGPFPLPLGQKRQEVLARFDAAVMDDSTDSGSKPLLHLRLTPKPDAPRIKDRRQFDRIDLWFDRDSLLPARVQTVEKASTTLVTLSQTKLNDPGISADLFKTDPPKDGSWQIQSKPWRE